MAVRRPLVLIDGAIQQLPLTDSLPGAGGGGLPESFETISKNLSASDATLTEVDGVLVSIAYSNGITKTFTYGPNGLATVVLSGAVPGGIDLTKTLVYSGGNLTNFLYS